MKRFLLSAVAMMATMGSFAQGQVAFNSEKLRKVEVAEPCAKQFAPTSMTSDKKVLAPRKSFESETWYLRPSGSYWLSGSYYDDNQVEQSYKYLVLPPFTDVQFLNASTNPENTKWYFGDEELTEDIDEDNNYKDSYSKPRMGYVSGLPTLKSGDDSYQVADYALICDSMPQLIHPFCYLDGRRYYGYSDGTSAFQSGPDEFDFDEDGEPETFYIDNFLQYFNKPASPMLLYDVVLWATAPNNKISNIGDLQLVFRRWTIEQDEEGQRYRALGDTIKILNCTSAEFDTEYISETAKVYPGTLIFAAEEEDEFGTPTATPFVIDSNYAIELSGFGLDEMDIRFYFTDQGANIEEYESWATPTFLMCCDEDNNYLGRLSYWNDYVDTKTGETVRYCYSIAYMFEVVMDGMNISEGTEVQKATAEGGESMADPQEGEEEGDPVYLWINLPLYDIQGEGQEAAATWTGNYDFEGIPEWAEIRIDPSYYEYEDEQDYVRGLNLVWFEVQPLPEGVEGRTATIKVVGATGLECETAITLIQGTVGDEQGINIVRFDADGKLMKTYNLAGQKVKNAKGITIQNGKKILQK